MKDIDGETDKTPPPIVPAGSAAAKARAHEQERTIKNWMRRHVEECVDGATGEVNCTALAEGAAQEVGDDSWLDEETHPVWDWAVEIAEVYEGKRTSRGTVRAR